MRYQISHKNTDDTDIALIMLAIAAEVAMDELIYDLLNRKFNSTPDEWRKTMEVNSSRSLRAKLFEKLAGGSLQNALQDNESHRGFINDWETVVKLRNEIVHGRCDDYRDWNPETGSKTLNLLVPARRFRESFLEGFIALNNHAYG